MPTWPSSMSKDGAKKPSTSQPILGAEVRQRQPHDLSKAMTDAAHYDGLLECFDRTAAVCSEAAMASERESTVAAAQWSSEPEPRGPPGGRNYPFATGTAMYDMAEPRFTRTSVFFMPADLA